MAAGSPLITWVSTACQLDGDQDVVDNTLLRVNSSDLDSRNDGTVFCEAIYDSRYSYCTILQKRHVPNNDW